MNPPPSYRRAFWRSRHHAWLGVLTLGLGFASGEPLALLAGATLYALGLVFLPDMGFFRRTVDAQLEARRHQAVTAELAAFQAQQDKLHSTLFAPRRARYKHLVEVCRDIEAASGDGPTPSGLDLTTRRGKLDELAWTYLRMLAIEQSLEVYLETERREQVPALVQTLQADATALTTEIEMLRQKSPRPAALEGKERLLTSRLERLATLQQRVHRIETAQGNLELIRSEQERLMEQVKLIRADAIASKNADTLTARIDLSIQHLAATNQWLAELAEFKDLTAQLPPPQPRAAGMTSTPTAARTPNPPATSSG